MKRQSQTNADPITRFAATLYFSLFALLFLLFAKYTLISLKDSQLLPLFPSLFIAIFTGGFIGRAFGPWLAKDYHWLKLFLLGSLMAVLTILFSSLAILIHAYFYDSTFLARLRYWQDYFVFYGAIVASITLVIGPWLLPLTGVAVIYFNKRFLPGLLAIDKMHRPKEDKKHD